MDDEVLYEHALSLGRALKLAGLSVAAAESCTGGWICKALTDVPGSSGWLNCGLVTYSNAAKHELLGVPYTLIEGHGAVSEQVVKAMAEGALARTDADLAIAVSGIAGPNGGTPEKPIGLVWFAWVRRGGRMRSECRQFEGDREDIRRAAVLHALDGLRPLIADA